MEIENSDTEHEFLSKLVNDNSQIENAGSELPVPITEVAKVENTDQIISSIASPASAKCTGSVISTDRVLNIMEIDQTYIAIESNDAEMERSDHIDAINPGLVPVEEEVINLNIETQESNIPSCTFPEYILEKPKLLAEIMYPSDENQFYIRGCKWSPDGTCLLYAVRGKGMTVVELPSDLYATSEIDENRNVTNLKAAVAIPENALLYDFCWFPGMSSQNPASCW